MNKHLNGGWKAAVSRRAGNPMERRFVTAVSRRACTQLGFPLIRRLETAAPWLPYVGAEHAGARIIVGIWG